MNLYVITTGTSDFGAMFVVRVHRVERGVDGTFARARPEAVCASLEEARDHVPDGLVRVPRDEHDDPVIVETWL